MTTRLTGKGRLICDGKADLSVSYWIEVTRSQGDKWTSVKGVVTATSLWDLIDRQRVGTILVLEDGTRLAIHLNDVYGSFNGEPE